MPRKFDCGGGCAVATASDYLRFAQMLLQRGSLDGARVLGSRTIDYMTSDHLGTAIARGNAYGAGPGYTWGLGFAVREAGGLAVSNGSAGDYFWPGAFGTSFWVDPKEELVVVYMMQAGPGHGRPLPAPPAHPRAAGHYRLSRTAFRGPRAPRLRVQYPLIRSRFQGMCLWQQEQLPSL